MNNVRVPILLSPKQLLRLENKPGILLIDTRPFPDYQKEHLPRAVSLPLLYYHWTDTSPEGIKAFNHHMQRVLALTGVSNRKHVIFYEDNSGMSASRGVWLLHYYGHNKTSLLDGGLRAWKKAGYKTTTETIPTKPAKFKVKLHPEVFANIRQVNRSPRRVQRHNCTRSPKRTRTQRTKRELGTINHETRNLQTTRKTRTIIQKRKHSSRPRNHHLLSRRIPRSPNLHRTQAAWLSSSEKLSGLMVRMGQHTQSPRREVNQGKQG